MNTHEGPDETVDDELALLAYFVHEIRSQMGAVQNYLAGASAINKDRRVEERITGASDHLMRLSQLLGELQIGKEPVGPVQLETLWASAVDGCKAVLDEHDVVVSADVPELLIYGRPNDLAAMLRHLLWDAVCATERGIVTLEVSVRDFVELVISGQPALGDTARPRMRMGFEGGAGRQMIASLIAEHHGGSLRMSSDNHVRVRLPMNLRPGV